MHPLHGFNARCMASITVYGVFAARFSRHHVFDGTSFLICTMDGCVMLAQGL